MDLQPLVNMYSSLFPPVSKFSSSDVPDLSGKVAIVTGGNAGIGKVMCRVLFEQNARVYMLSRSPTKAEEAIAELQKAAGKLEGIHFIQCDLADLPSVKLAAEDFVSKERHLHLLFNSAGVSGTPMEMITKQGYDLQFGTNVLGHAHLTELLLPTLLETAKVSAPGTVRIVTTSSSANNVAPKDGVMYDTLQDGPERNKNGSPSLLYFQSKWVNVVYAKELARRYGDQGIVSIALDPGHIKTDIWRHAPPWMQSFVNTWILQDVEKGALTPLFAGTTPEAADMNGKFLIPFARVGRARKDTDDAKSAEKLFKWLDEQLKDL